MNYTFDGIQGNYFVRLHFCLFSFGNYNVNYCKLLQDTIEEIVRKSRKSKPIASQKIEIGQTSVERPQLIAAITIEVEETDDKSMPLQMLQKRQKGTKQIASKKKKI